MKPTLIIMAKAPIMGRAKTRLARDIGPTHAKRLYRAMMGEVMRNTSDPRWNTVLAVTPTAAMGNVPDWRGHRQIPQSRGSLTPRLNAVFKRRGPVVCIGTDCPDVTARDIAAAFKALADMEARFNGRVTKLRTLIDVDDLKALRARKGLF